MQLSNKSLVVELKYRVFEDLKKPSLLRGLFILEFMCFVVIALS